MQNRPRVGEILVSAGIIDEFQLAAALGEQQRWGRRLGVTLIKMGMVEEGHLIRALAKQLDLPVASLAGKRIPEDVLALVPARVASEHGVIPLFIKEGGRNGQLFLGMEDPLNLAVLDDLSFRTGMEIHPVMVGPSELGEAIGRCYHARKGGAPRPDPLEAAEPMNPASLRVVTDDSAQPGTAPAEPSIESEIQAAAASRAASVVTPPIELDDPVAAPGAPQAPASPATPDGLAEDVRRIGEALEDLRADFDRTVGELSSLPADVAAAMDTASTAGRVAAQASEETERTRVVAKAITTLLVEKGVLGLDALRAQISLLKAAAEVDDEDGDLEPLDD